MRKYQTFLNFLKENIFKIYKIKIKVIKVIEN